MDKAEKAQLKEIERVKEAIEKTNSEYLKRDYKKNLHCLRRELKEYRRYKYGTT